ncbi:MAG: hypothetical protein A2Y62_19355 [Candidatus Fischerbacteria bacterium RBG_13_37_8]|uniref:Uncharacterized protein n=1 Tax=Candidatus Fischerbacteria bacterium RBG_13_37_8 TaxID=1817863 RepID=A0A1F5VXI5_9BACT|nr:MAG: hypothetical protein A2Y62_19355 [Candidatus Fischerbacteria bacterium RBG_13_37_8]
MKNTIKALNELREKGLIKDYAIGGAIAALRWTEPFFTQDLDIFVILEKDDSESKLIVLTPIYEYLKAKGCVWEKHWLIIEGVPVDIFPADDLEMEAIENAQETEYETVKTKIMTPEYLIALFLRAGREKDKRKIQMLLEQSEIDIEKLNSVLQKYGLIDKFEEYKKSY